MVEHEENQPDYNRGNAFVYFILGVVLFIILIFYVMSRNYDALPVAN